MSIDELDVEEADGENASVDAQDDENIASTVKDEGDDSDSGDAGDTEGDDGSDDDEGPSADDDIIDID